MPLDPQGSSGSTPALEERRPGGARTEAEEKLTDQAHQAGAKSGSARAARSGAPAASAGVGASRR